MAMYEDEHQSKRITVECKNCERFISFMMVPKTQPVVGEFYCNLKCIDEMETKRKKAKEQLTETTLKG